MSLDYYIHKHYNNDITAINHSGGANGSDYWWAKIGKQYHIKTLSYSFKTHRISIGNRIILKQTILKKAIPTINQAAINLNRRFPISTYSQYKKNLILRNYFPILYSDVIIALGYIHNNISEDGEKINTIVKGGTGWSIEIAKILKKKIYIYDINKKQWYKSFKITKNNKIIHLSKFISLSSTELPKLSKNFAGIGTRYKKSNEFPEILKKEIKKVYDYNYNHKN